jgi:hypothetical protein
MLLIKIMFQVREASNLKGLKFFTFTKGMPIMLLYNIKTSLSLVNRMTRIAKRAILNTDV